MNSSEVAAMKNQRTEREARPAFTWIERFALPIAVSAMEAQPIALVIALLTALVTKNPAQVPFEAGRIMLIALGLLWWAMLVEHIKRNTAMSKWISWLHGVGWLVTLLVVVGPLLLTVGKGDSIFAILLNTMLITWLWRRSLPRSQIGFEYGPLATSFKVSFGIVLAILLITILFTGPELRALDDGLASTLPVFFLSGLVGLSLARLGVLRSARRSLHGVQADSTRSWLLALTIFCVTLIVIVIVIESFFSFASFELVVTMLSPLWNALGTLVSWILYGLIFFVSPIFYVISFLVGLLTHGASSLSQPQTVLKPSHIQQAWQPQTLSPEILTIGRWLFIALMLIIVLLVVRASLRWRLRPDEDERIEEVREGLNAHAVIGKRWQEWWNRGRHRRHGILPSLERLDPESARARYREMLQAIAEAKGFLTRKPAETPIEYETRLREHLQDEVPNAQNLAGDKSVPTDTIILDELTRAYVRERYGSKHTEQHKRIQLQAWVPRFIERLTGKAATDAPRRFRHR
jgi:hypothetical protein